MKKINNKGFVISSILYTLLISFLLVLSLLLLQFKSSSDVISNASKDLVNGEEFKAVQLLDDSYVSFTDFSGNLVTLDDKNTNLSSYTYVNGVAIPSGGLKYECSDDISDSKIQYNGSIINGLNYKYFWYNPPNKMLVRISSRYGTVYWPKDFLPTLDISSTDTYGHPNELTCVDINLSDPYSSCTKKYKNIEISIDAIDVTSGTITLKINDSNNSALGLVNGSKCDGDTDVDPNNCIVLSKPSTGCD